MWLLATFRQGEMAAGKLATPSGTLLEFLLRDRHNLLEFISFAKTEHSKTLLFWEGQT